MSGWDIVREVTEAEIKHVSNAKQSPACGQVRVGSNVNEDVRSSLNEDIRSK